MHEELRAAIQAIFDRYIGSMITDELKADIDKEVTEVVGNYGMECIVLIDIDPEDPNRLMVNIVDKGEDE